MPMAQHFHTQKKISRCSDLLKTIRIDFQNTLIIVTQPHLNVKNLKYKKRLINSITFSEIQNAKKR